MHGYRGGDRIVKLNKGGLKLAAVYLCYFLLMCILQFALGGPNSEGFLFFLALLPFAIVARLLEAVGLGNLAVVLLVRSPYGLLIIPISFIIVYLIGWGASAFAKRMKSVKPDPSMPVVDPPNWSDRA